MNLTVPPKTFHFILIKPSHYDDEGYVIQWIRSSIPSNMMAAIYGLAMDCAERQVLGSDVHVSITALDETNTRINPPELADMVQRDGGQGLIAMVGVQTNQFPRAMDLARQFRQAELPVCIGGFHVSGCFAMLPAIPSDLQEAMDEGISLFAGEVEGHLDRLLQDASAGQLQFLYNVMKDPPGLEGQPVPYLPAHLVHRMLHARMSEQELLEAYHQALDTYYTPEHVETVIRRAQAWQFSVNEAKWMMLSFYAAAKVEGVHPMDSGIFRRKYRRDRRGGLRQENPFLFYARYGWEIATKHLRYVWLYLMFHRAYRRVLAGVTRGTDDIAMQPVKVEELETLELSTATPAAQIVVEKLKKRTRTYATAVSIQ